MKYLPTVGLILSFLGGTAILPGLTTAAQNQLDELGLQTDAAWNTSSPGIKSVSVNKDGWIVVEGFGAESGDCLFVTIAGRSEPRLSLHPWGENGQFKKLCPSLQLMQSREKFLPARIVIGPPRWGDISRPAMERFLWEGEISAKHGARRR